MYGVAFTCNEQQQIPVVGLFLVNACCWGSVLLSAMLTCASVPTLRGRSLVSTGLLGSLASAVACTRGGRPGGGAGIAGPGLEVRVTGTTATGAKGARAAAMGTSGLTSEGKVSEVASLKAGAEVWGWSGAEARGEGSGAEGSSSAPGSARPFRALGAGVGEAARACGASEGGLSVLRV